MLRAYCGWASLDVWDRPLRHSLAYIAWILWARLSLDVCPGLSWAFLPCCTFCGHTCRREAGLLGSSGCRSTLLLLLHIILVRYPELCLLMRLVFGTFLRTLHGPAHNMRETLTYYPSIGDPVNGLISELSIPLCIPLYSSSTILHTTFPRKTPIYTLIVCLANSLQDGYVIYPSGLCDL